VDSETEKPLLTVIHSANCLELRSVCARATSWMPSILKASLPCSGSPAVAVALGYSKL